MILATMHSRRIVASQLVQVANSIGIHASPGFFSPGEISFTVVLMLPPDSDFGSPETIERVLRSAPFSFCGSRSRDGNSFADFFPWSIYFRAFRCTCSPGGALFPISEESDRE